jgi:hypothetical protein
MPSGYTVAGRGDLDALLMARVNAKRADVGYAVAGVDISNRYEPIGNGTPIAATGFKSGDVDLANLFRNIGEALVSITVSDLTATCNVSGSSATAQYRLDADGSIYATQGGPAIPYVGDWITPKGAQANYQCHAALVSGTLSSGTINAWLAFPQTWTATGTAVGTPGQAVIDVSIRSIADSVVRDTARITIRGLRTS